MFGQRGDGDSGLEWRERLGVGVMEPSGSYNIGFRKLSPDLPMRATISLGIYNIKLFIL